MLGRLRCLNGARRYTRKRASPGNPERARRAGADFVSGMPWGGLHRSSTDCRMHQLSLYRAGRPGIAAASGSDQTREGGREGRWPTESRLAGEEASPAERDAVGAAGALPARAGAPGDCRLRYGGELCAMAIPCLYANRNFEDRCFWSFSELSARQKFDRVFRRSHASSRKPGIWTLQKKTPFKKSSIYRESVKTNP